MSGRFKATLRTPWGTSQWSRRVADGVHVHETAGHGGIEVRRDVAQRLLPRAVRLVATGSAFHRNPGGSLWFEEDCEAVVVLLSMPQAFEAAGFSPNLDGCRATAARLYPDALAAIDSRAPAAQEAR